MVSEIFDASEWSPVAGFDLTDITYHRHVRLGMVRVAFNRPEVRNAFRPHTVDELYAALEHARITSDVGVVLLTGNGPSPKDGGWAFCSGGDQRIRGDHGYRYEVAGASAADAPKGSGPREAGPLAHPRGPATHPVHAEGRDRGGPGLGRGRRAQPARRLRSDAGQRRARDVQADRRRRRQLRRRLRLGVPREDGRPEEGARDLFPRRRVHGRPSRGDGRGQRGGAARRSRRRRSRGARRSWARVRPPYGC